MTKFANTKIETYHIPSKVAFIKNEKVFQEWSVKQSGGLVKAIAEGSPAHEAKNQHSGQ